VVKVNVSPGNTFERFSRSGGCKGGKRSCEACMGVGMKGGGEQILGVIQ